MNNKFALSFGISLIFVGLLNIFFETNSIIIFGLSLSTIIFSIINFFVANSRKKVLEFLYIIPLVLLVSIFCYSNSLMKYEIIRNIVNSRMTNVLTFLSFGFLFISEFKNYGSQKNQYMNYQESVITESLEYSALILGLQTEYLNLLSKNPEKINDESANFYRKIEKLCNEKIRLSKIDLELLKKKKTNFSIQELNSAYQKYNTTLNIEEKMKKYNESINKNRRPKKRKNNK